MAMVNQKSTKYNNQKKRVSDRDFNLLGVLSTLYPNRHIRIEAISVTVAHAKGCEQVHEVWTQPKQDTSAKWQLIQKGLLSAIRRYCTSELSNNYIRGDAVAWN